MLFLAAQASVKENVLHDYRAMKKVVKYPDLQQYPRTIVDVVNAGMGRCKHSQQTHPRSTERRLAKSVTELLANQLVIPLYSIFKVRFNTNHGTKAQVQPNCSAMAKLHGEIMGNP